MAAIFGYYYKDYLSSLPIALTYSHCKSVSFKNWMQKVVSSDNTSALIAKWVEAYYEPAWFTDINNNLKSNKNIRKHLLRPGYGSQSFGYINPITPPNCPLN